MSDEKELEKKNNFIRDGFGEIQNMIRDHQYKKAPKEIQKILGDLDDEEMEEDMINYWIMLGEKIGAYKEEYEK